MTQSEKDWRGEEPLQRLGQRRTSPDIGPLQRTALVDRKERGPTLATRTRTETWRKRRKITHWWSALLVALIYCTTDIVQARVDRHQNLSSLHRPSKLSVLTMRSGCNGAHSGTWGKIGNVLIWWSGGDDSLWRSNNGNITVRRSGGDDLPR